ncbi:MAG: polyprenyl synthetase family protein [Syntrophaceae bacterium]|nr:polyprenyl synthetase family protein [Syntrophaceae bacterium]
MTIQDIFQYYAADLGQVEAFMEREFRSEVALIPEISHYLIGSGGKRFRPLLLIACANLSGYRGERSARLAAVLEFIHTATLLHDDVIDEGQLRRGKASANTVWGNAASVLVGDFLYSKSFRILSDDGSIDVLRLMSETTNIMSEGEVFQLVRSGDVRITEQDYLTIIEKKTAILMAAACAIGGILGGHGQERTAALRRFGLLLGMAFQMTDDTLDYMAEEAQFGKTIGKDLQEGKLTLPLIIALGRCAGEERERITGLVEEMKRTGGGDGVGEVVDCIRRHNGISYTLGKAEAFVTEAKECLNGFGASEAKNHLVAIAGFILERRT